MKRLWTDLLVNYVERVGFQYSQDLSEKKGEEGEKHIQQTLAEVKSNLAQHLGNIDIKRSSSPFGRKSQPKNG